MVVKVARPMRMVMRNLRPMTLKETRGPAVRPLIPVVFGAEESVVCGFEALRGCDDEMA